MSIVTAVWVPGIPRTKGSLSFYGNGNVQENVRFSKEWRKQVRDAVYADRVARGLTTPSTAQLGVTVRCYVEASADGAGMGDTDKLERNVGDALADPQFNQGTRGKLWGTEAIKNDNLIIKWDAVKLVDPTVGYGLLVICWELSEQEKADLRRGALELLRWAREGAGRP